MPRRSPSRLELASSVAQSVAIPFALPGLALGPQVAGPFHGAAILTGVAAGAVLIMIVAWRVLRRVARQPKASPPAKNVDLSTLRSISLDGDAIDAALVRSEGSVATSPSVGTATKFEAHNIPIPPVLTHLAPGAPPAAPAAAPKLRLGTTGGSPPASTSPASSSSPQNPPSAPNPVQAMGPSIKLSAPAGPRLHGRPGVPATKPDSAPPPQEPAAQTPSKPVSLHERIQAIDVEQMITVMKAVFERQGFHPLTNAGPDRRSEGDFALEKDGEVTLVSCRPAAEPRDGLLGVQEFAERMGSAGIGKGLLLAVKGYTFEARGGASSHGITIMDGPEVLRLLESVHAGTDPELSRALSGPTVPTPPAPGPASLKLARHD